MPVLWRYRYAGGEWPEQHAVAAGRQRDSGEKLSD